MIPYVSKEQISKLDELMVDHFEVSILMMMEQAGYRLAEFVRKVFPIGNILILAGKGNNGGDGLAAARHLLNFGYSPRLFLITEELKDEPKKHLEIAQILHIPTFTSLEELEEETTSADVILDCLIGYNLNGNPRGKFAEAIERINNSKKPIIACDVPSGVGEELFVKASLILFLSLPKLSCKDFPAKKFVADIGVPADLYPMIDVERKFYFRDEGIVEVE